MPTPEIEAKAERMAQRPLLRLAFFFPSEDATVVRDFNMADVEAQLVPESFGAGVIEIPGWVREPLQQWEHPQDPVTFSGVVNADQEVEAWNVITEKLPEVADDDRRKAFESWMEAEGIETGDLDGAGEAFTTDPPPKGKHPKKG